MQRTSSLLTQSRVLGLFLCFHMLRFAERKPVETERVVYHQRASMQNMRPRNHPYHSLSLSLDLMPSLCLSVIAQYTLYKYSFLLPFPLTARTHALHYYHSLVCTFTIHGPMPFVHSFSSSLRFVTICTFTPQALNNLNIVT
uniref:Secreted peptide n=1 Tax=Anopheles braziliensis TaxID=58242 RepID=A0A2M3ZMC7_9DIPT